MSDQDRPREEMRTASDLWPKRQRPPLPEGEPAELSPLQLHQLPSSGASDLRPNPRPDTPPRRTSRSGATTRDQAQSADLRPERPVDTPIRRESRGNTEASRDLQERVERIRQVTGQPVGEHRPPVTGIQALTKPAYTPPPYSPPRAAVPARPDETSGEQSSRLPLGSYPAGSQPRQDSGNRSAPVGEQPPTNGQAGSQWQEQNGSGQRPPNGPGPGAAPSPGNPPSGQYQQPWPSGQQAPPKAPPNWGGPVPPPAQWQGQPPGPNSQQPPWAGYQPAPWQPQPGHGQPGYGQPWPVPAARPGVQPIRMAGSGRAPWGIREIAIIVVGGLALTIALLFLALGILEGSGVDTTDTLDPVVFLALGSTMYLGFGVAIWAVLIAWRKRTWADLGFRRTRVSSILWMIPLAVGVLVIVSLVGLAQEWLFDISPPADSGLPIEAGNLNAGSILAAALVAVVLAPIFEELFFRGVLFQYLRSRYLLVARGLFEAVLISALAFASLHLGGAILPILPVGVILALVMHRTNSLWPAIALHMFYNGIVLAISLATLS